MTYTEYPLSPEERSVIDEISAQISDLSAQRTGMLLFLARIKGAENAAIDYANGVLRATPREM